MRGDDDVQVGANWRLTAFLADESMSNTRLICATRYTAVTCDPDNFEENKYFLRQNILERETELAIVITLYVSCLFAFC